MTKFRVSVVVIRLATLCSKHLAKNRIMENNATGTQNQSTSGLLEQWSNMMEGARASLAKASEIASRMECACIAPSNDGPQPQVVGDVRQVEFEADGEFELRRPRVSSGESSASDSFKMVGRITRDRSPAKFGPVPRNSDQSGEIACAEMETSMDLFRRRKTVHEIPQIVINTPEGADRFKRRRSTGEPRTPRMQLSCVNSPGTPSAHMPRTPIPLAKHDPCTPDTHYHPPLVGGANSCRKREISTTDNCPDTPPPKSNATPIFSHDDMRLVFEKIKLEAPSKLIPSDDSKRWEYDMNAAFYSAFKLIAAGMERVEKESRLEFFPAVPSTSSGKSKSVMTSLLEDVVAPLEILMTTEIEDEEWAEETLASIEEAVDVINKQVPLELNSTGCAEQCEFFHRRVGQKVETITGFMQKANHKVTDEMRRAHFLDSEVDFGSVATHVSELLRSYNEAMCQLDFMSSGPSIHKLSHET